jgi:succinyl-diaminopimelate desuccinylase
MELRGMYVDSFEWENYRSIVSTIQPNHKTPTIMLYAHVDVVPVSNDSMWNVQTISGKLYGRGVFDMKYAIAIYLKLIDELKHNLQTYDFGITIVSDEETGLGQGAQRLIEEGYIPKVCIMPDGGDDWHIETVAKGFWHFKIDAQGVSSHGSRPWLGKNAYLKLAPVIREINALFNELQKPETCSLTVGYVRSGDAINQVPGLAEAGFDMRFISKENYSEIKSQIDCICHDHGVKLTTIQAGDTYYSDINDPYLAQFIITSEEVEHIVLRPCVSLGTSDARFYAIAGVPCIQVSPTGGDRHSDNEWVSMVELSRYKKIIKAYLINMRQK